MNVCGKCGCDIICGDCGCSPLDRAAEELGAILKESGVEPYFVPPPGKVTACICTWPDGYPGRAKLDPRCPYGNHAKVAKRSTPGETERVEGERGGFCNRRWGVDLACRCIRDALHPAQCVCHCGHSSLRAAGEERPKP